MIMFVIIYEVYNEIADAPSGHKYVAEKGAFTMFNSPEIDAVCGQLESFLNISRMFIFGVKQKGEAMSVTDFDICLVLDFDEEKRNAITADIYRKTESEIPFDVFLYTPEQFERFSREPSSFVSRILRQGYEYGKK